MKKLNKKKIKLLNIFSYRSGFTLIELLVTITIMLVLMSMSLVSYAEFSKKVALKGAVGEIKALIKLVQSRALFGDIINCDSGLEGFVIAFSNKDLLDPTKFTMTEKCVDGSLTPGSKSYDLDNVKTINLSPASVSYPNGFFVKVLYGGIDFGDSISDVNVTVDTGSLDCTFTIHKGGDTTDCI